MATLAEALTSEATKNETTPTSLINGSARDTQAYLSRAQWDDYKARFVPLENKLLNAYDNQEMKQDSINQAVGYSNSAFDASQGTFNRNMARYGISMTPQQKASIQSSSNLSRALANVDAANRTRTALNERDQQIMSGGLTVSPIAA